MKGIPFIKLKFPQWIMITYLGVLIVLSLHIGLHPLGALNDAIVKFAMNGVLVLSLIPMINGGLGMNFGMPIGVTAGTIGMLVAIQFKWTLFPGFLGAIGVAVVVAIVLGYLYGKLLNWLKGNEEIVSMFVGYSFIPLINIFYTLAPFTNRQMLYPVGGIGLRPKINLEMYFADILDHAWVMTVGGFKIPIMLLMAYGLVAALIYYVFHSRLGDEITSVSENPEFAGLSGVDMNKTRVTAVIFSTIIAAIGICVYAQSYGFVEAYDGPTNLVFPAVSAILIGGASRKHAKISHAIIGTFLYQSTYLLSVPVANSLLMPQMAEILRMFVTNTIILYAFFYDGREKRGKQMA